MSLIQDALKTAQREKSRRDSQSERSFAPVLVRLRARPESSPNRKYFLAAGGGLIAVVATLIVLRAGKDAPLPTVPPVTSTILSQALASDPGTRAQPPAPRASRPVAETTQPIARATLRPAPAARTAVADALPQPPKTGTAAVFQGEPQDAPVRTAPPPRQVQSVGALRIAVDQPREPDAARLFAEAVAAHRAGDFARAQSLYERVLVIAPNDGDALNNLGVLLSGRREFDRALDLLRRAASVAPRNAGAWNNIGTVLREQGKSADAIAAFKHALTIDLQHQGARVGLAQQYLAINSLSQARELLQDVLVTNPALPEAHYTLGQVLELQGDRAGAISSYSSFIRFAPTRLASHAELVRRRIDVLNERP